MTSLADTLKSEISRVARKELKPELLSLRKAVTAHRSEIAALKRDIKTLASLLKTQAKLVKSTVKAAPAEDEETPQVRGKFSAKAFATWRAKVGITQLQAATLLEASSLSVFKWETDKTKPRAAQVVRLKEVMKMGKRAVHAALAA